MHLQGLGHKGNIVKIGGIHQKDRMLSVVFCLGHTHIEDIMGCGFLTHLIFPSSLSSITETKEKRKLICLRGRSLERHYMEICCTFAAEVV